MVGGFSYSRLPLLAQTTSIFPTPREAFNPVSDFALPKVFEFFAVILSVVVVISLVNAFRK